jgi:Ca-activated chloride channel homolog
VTLLTPLGLLAAVAAVPLVLWYLLRPRRRRVAVGSVFLWHAVDRPATAATPWQRFRGDSTFWLVLLALLALAVALASPGLRVPAALGDHTILVVDISGSMLAEEDGATRADLARAAAGELVADLAPGQEVSVILAGTRPEVAVSGTADAREVTRVIAATPGTHGPGDLADALVLATSLQRPGERTVVHVLTDADLTADAASVAPPGTGVTTVGTNRPNVAVTRLTSTAAGAGDHRVLAQVRSYASQSLTGRLVISVGDQPLVEQPLRLAPRAIEDVLLTVPADGGQLLTAAIAIDPDADGLPQDALPHDDVATTVLADPVEVTALIAGPGNPFLAAALGSVPGVTVQEATTVPADLAGVDVLLVDRIGAPATPTVPTILIAPTTYPDGVLAVADEDAPVLTFQSTDHPLLSDVDLTGVAIARSTRLDAPALTTIAAGPQGPLLLAGRLAGAPIVVLPFDLLSSDLPLRPAWPLLVANTVGWATGGEAGTVAIPAGTVATIGTTATSVRASPPDGGPAITSPVGEGGTASLLLDRVGTWRVEQLGGEADGDELLVPVTTAPEEGDLEGPRLGTPLSTTTTPGPTTTTPAPTDSVGGDVGGDGGSGDREVTGSDAQGIASLVRWFVAGALVLALAEWTWSQRLADRWRARRAARRAARAPAEREPAGVA